MIYNKNKKKQMKQSWFLMKNNKPKDGELIIV